LVENLAPEGLDDLVHGRASLALEKSGRGLVGYKNLVPPRASADIEKIIHRLQECRSRDEGFSLLSDAQLTRRELEAIARQLGLPILKSDTAERLESKLIESCIGARLTSEAIRGRRKVLG
jgi:hypothetical protein